MTQLRATQHNPSTTRQDMEPITIVSGLPRCGTSLAMQMLCAGGLPALTDGVRQPDEDNPRGYLEFEPVKQTASDASWLGQAQGKAVKLVYRLLFDLPLQYSYRVILMQREMAEMLASQRAMLARQRQTGAALSDEQLTRVFANEMTRCREWLARQPQFAVLEVNYNELMAGPGEQVARIDTFLGGELNVAAMVDCVDPALYRQRVPQATAG